MQLILEWAHVSSSHKYQYKWNCKFGHYSVFPRMLTNLLSKHASGSTPRNWCGMHAASDAGRAHVCCLSDLDGGVVTVRPGPCHARGLSSSGSAQGPWMERRGPGPVSAVSDDCKHWTLNEPKLKVDTDSGHANKTNQPVIKTWH